MFYFHVPKLKIKQIMNETEMKWPKISGTEFST